MITQYVKLRSKKLDNGNRVGRGIKIGVLIGALINDKIAIGHSKWCRKLDKYDSEFAKKVAMDRLESESKAPPALSIANAYIAFIERCKRYYKTDELSENTKEAIKALSEKKAAQKTIHKIMQHPVG